MQSVQKVRELKLHTDLAGRIWFGDRQRQEATGSDLNPDEFARQGWVRKARAIRILGSRENASLICALQLMQSVGAGPTTVWIGNPNFVPRNVRRSETVFGRMDGHELPASLGGWHQMTRHDFVTYAIIEEWRRAGEMTGKLQQLFKVHPAYPALSFLPDLIAVKACELLTVIVDPRWRVDPNKPDRDSRLKSFLGLGNTGLANMQAILTGESEKARRGVENARLVLDTWTGGGGYVPPPQDMVGPEGFLWRVTVRLKSSSDGLVAFRRMLRACHVFLRFVRGVWLDNLTASRVYEPVTCRLGGKGTMATYRRLRPCKEYSPRLFAPEHFFGTDTVVQAWREHLEKLPCR